MRRRQDVILLSQMDKRLLKDIGLDRGRLGLTLDASIRGKRDGA
ncbi:DUF1127 domain-containing protein [Paracoccus aurantius]